MEKEKLMNFIKECKASGKDPHAESAKRLADVIKGLEINTAPFRRLAKGLEINTAPFRRLAKGLEINTAPFRLAWSKPLGFYALHTTKEAIDILTAEANKNNT